MKTPKHRVGTKLKQRGHILITIIEVTPYNYLCEQTDYPAHTLSLSFEFLDEGGWVKQNPIWLK